MQNKVKILQKFNYNSRKRMISVIVGETFLLEVSNKHSIIDYCASRFSQFSTCVVSFKLLSTMSLRRRQWLLLLIGIRVLLRCAVKFPFFSRLFCYVINCFLRFLRLQFSRDRNSENQPWRIFGLLSIDFLSNSLDLIIKSTLLINQLSLF